ncbi:MAG TPA: ComF family protein [Ktedonobacteraceae bacterium]
MPASHIQQVRYFIQQALDIVFPVECVLCARVGSVLCSDCQPQLQVQQNYTRCAHCHAPLTENGQCLPCSVHPLRLHGLRAYAGYQGALRQCIHALKYDGQTRLAQPLGALLAQTYHRYGMQADYLIPLPLHNTRQKQRGYNHATLLTRACAEQLGVLVHEELVIRQRATPSQVGLTPQQRHQNVSGAFSILPTVTTRTIFKRRLIIIDDVCTTGATLEACAETLLSAGARSVWGLVLARSDLSTQHNTP